MVATRVTDELIDDYTAAGDWRGVFVDDHLRDRAADMPDKVCVHDRSGEWTYRDLDDRVDALAAAMQDRGVGQGDIVSWQLPNWVEAFVVHLAIVRIGAVSNPILPIYRHTELSFT